MDICEHNATKNKAKFEGEKAKWRPDVMLQGSKLVQNLDRAIISNSFERKHPWREFQIKIFKS